MCWNVLGETMKGYCVGFCDGDHDNPTCAEPNTECAVTGNDVLRLCLPFCDPLIQDCPIGELCTYEAAPLKRRRRCGQPRRPRLPDPRPRQARRLAG